MNRNNFIVEEVLSLFVGLLLIVSFVGFLTNKQTLHEPCKNSYICPIK